MNTKQYMMECQSVSGDEFRGVQLVYSMGFRWLMWCIKMDLTDKNNGGRIISRWLKKYIHVFQKAAETGSKLIGMLRIPLSFVTSTGQLWNISLCNLHMHEWSYSLLITDGMNNQWPQSNVGSIEGRAKLICMDGFYITKFNPLRAKFFRGNINIYLHFIPFLLIDLTQVLKSFLE